MYVCVCLPLSAGSSFSMIVIQSRVSAVQSFRTVRDSSVLSWGAFVSSDLIVKVISLPLGDHSRLTKSWQMGHWVKFFSPPHHQPLVNCVHVCVSWSCVLTVHTHHTLSFENGGIFLVDSDSNVVLKSTRNQLCVHVCVSCLIRCTEINVDWDKVVILNRNLDVEFIRISSQWLRLKWLGDDKAVWVCPKTHRHHQLLTAPHHPARASTISKCSRPLVISLPILSIFYRSWCVRVCVMFLLSWPSRSICRRLTCQQILIWKSTKNKMVLLLLLASSSFDDDAFPFNCH